MPTRPSGFLRWFSKDQPKKRADSRHAAQPHADRELAAVSRQVVEAKEELARLDAERTELLAERRRLQQVLGERAGKRTMARSRVEKTTGIPSFVAGARLFQRIHRRADDPSGGLDAAGTLFADPEDTAHFARSHGVPSVVPPASSISTTTILVHAFQGTIGLVELSEGGFVRHLDEEQRDLGNIRPGVKNSTDVSVSTALADVCQWSATLSRHIPRPYVQVLWQDHTEGPALTRIDVDPDRIPVLVPEWDQRLGQLFDSAHARMLLQPFHAGALDNRVPGGTFSPEETS